MNIDNITAMEYDDRPNFGHQKNDKLFIIDGLDRGDLSYECITIVINYYVQLTYLWDQWTFSKRRGTRKIVCDTFELHSRKIKPQYLFIF